MRSYQYEKAGQFSLRFHRRKPIVQKDRYEAWREVADLPHFKIHERLRVEWMVLYYTVAKENATLTTQHFGISRKTFHKWLKRFKDSKYNVKSLADQSRVPCRKRTWEVTLAQQERIRGLRNKYPYYGKKKLKVIFGLARLLGLTKADGDQVELTERGAFYIHLLQNYFTLNHIDRVWSAATKESWPDKIEI